MQDALVHTVKSISLWCVAARDAGATAEEMYEANWWTLRSTFSTLTNVNFDEDRIAEVRFYCCSNVCNRNSSIFIFILFPFL